MQEEIRKDFLPLASKPGWVMTWLIRIFGGAILLIVFVALAVLPFLVSGSVTILIIVALLYYPVCAIAMYKFFRHVKKNMSVAIRKIRVDDQGIHFYKKDGSIKEILYSQLGASYLSDEYQVYLTTEVKTWVLAVGIDHNEIKVIFDGTDIGCTHYIKNGRALRARFIEGIVRFRPDLKIDPFVFKEFSIHPEKFTFDGKRYMKHVAKGAVAIAIMLLFSLLIMLIITIL